MVKVEEMAREPDFGSMSKIDIAYNSYGQTTQTYLLNKRQSIAVASRLNTNLLMKGTNVCTKLHQLHLLLISK